MISLQNGEIHVEIEEDAVVVYEVEQYADAGGQHVRHLDECQADELANQLAEAVAILRSRRRNTAQLALQLH